MRGFISYITGEPCNIDDFERLYEADEVDVTLQAGIVLDLRLGTRVFPNRAPPSPPSSARRDGGGNRRLSCPPAVGYRLLLLALRLSASLECKD